MNFNKIILSILLLAVSSVQAAPRSNTKNQAIYSQAIVAVQQKNFTKALQLLQPLANQGDAVAQNNIAVLYEEGLGVPRSDKEALKWYHKAAQQGQAEAQFMVGLFHAEGRGTAQNYEQAFAWYSKAAKQGNADAQNNLAMRYASGTGVQQNVKLAKFWFAKAAANGNTTVAQSLRELNALQQSGKIK